MPGFSHILRCVGRAAVKNGARALARLVPLGEAVFEIATDAHEEFRKDRGEADLRADLEGLARASHPDRSPGDERAEARPGRVQGPCDRRDDPPVTVTGPQRTYTLLGLLAVGDVADVHLARAGCDPGTAAEPFYALKVSRIPGGDAFLDNERRALASLLTAADDTTYRKYLPDLAESFKAFDGFPKRVHVFRYEPGFYTLEQVHEQHPALDGRHLAWVFNRLLTVLGFSHGQGIVHGAVLPCHVLIHAANHGLRLVGWGQSVETARPVNAISTRYKDWYPPEVLNKQPASPATDLFLAARCLIYLAGGDPVRDRMPDAVPAPVQRFVKACLLEGARMRPHDAWELLEEFGELLRRLYGPPTFHELTMT
jgi:hypothetical protein